MGLMSSRWQSGVLSSICDTSSMKPPARQSIVCYQMWSGTRLDFDLDDIACGLSPDNVHWRTFRLLEYGHSYGYELPSSRTSTVATTAGIARGERTCRMIRPTATTE